MRTAPPAGPAERDPAPATAAEHVVITLHGIRTYGQWQERLGRMLEAREPGVCAYHYHYGYFSLLAFLVPMLRWLEVRRFRRWLVRTLAQHPHARRIDLVAHSFGTHLAAWALRGIPAARRPRLHTVILAGSVLPPHFPWDGLLRHGHVRRVVNECGTADRVLVLNQAVVLFTGMAGRVGFTGGLSSHFLNRYYPFGHSGYFERGRRLHYDRFMRARWLPLLTTEADATPVDKRRPLTSVGGLVEWLLGNLGPVKTTAWSGLLCGIIALFVGLYLAAEEARREAHEYRLKAEEKSLRAEDHRREAYRQWRKAEDERRWQEVYAGRATQAVGLLSDIGETGLADAPQMEGVRRALLQQALAFHQQFLGDDADSPKVRKETARAYRRVADLQAQLGRHAEAETAYRRAIVLQEKLVRDLPREADFRRDLAGSHHNLGLLLAEGGRSAEAEAALRHALELQEALARDFPGVPGYRHDLGTTSTNLGVLLAAGGRAAEAEKCYRRALGIRERLAGEGPGNAAYLREVALVNNNLGALLGPAGKADEADVCQRRALAAREQLVRGFPGVAAYRRDLAYSYYNRSIHLAGAGHAAEAEALLRKAVALREELVRDFPQTPAYREELAQGYFSLGLRLHEAGRLAEAEEPLRRALALREKLAADCPAVPAHRQDVGKTLNNLGALLTALGRPLEAVACHRQALALREQLVKDFPSVAAYRQDLAYSCNNLGVQLAALAWVPRAGMPPGPMTPRARLAAAYPAFFACHGCTTVKDAHRAALLTAAGRRREAAECYLRTLALRELLADKFPDDPAYRRELAATHTGLGRLLGEVPAPPTGPGVGRAPLSGPGPSAS